MSDDTNLVPTRDAPTNLLGIIAAAAVDPRVDTAKMEKLLDLQERIMASQRKVEFDEAMVRVQAKLPQIEKFGRAKNSRFVKYEDLSLIIKPLLVEEQFTLSFNEESRTDTTVTFVLEVARCGHSKFHRLTVQTDRASKNRDGQAIRPAIQDDGSTASYARRYLVKLALDIVEKDEDTDGHNLEPITGEQVKDLETMLTDIGAKVDTPLRKRFYAHMGVTELKTIHADDYPKALAAINSKRNP